MAAYASLLSLMTTLNNIQIHPRVSTFFDHQQIQSLLQIINFLIHFIESRNSHGGSREEEEEEEEAALERRIASRAHGAEDIIESHVVDQLLAGSADLLDLETEVEDMNSIKERVMVMVMEFEGKMKLEDEESSPASSKPLTSPKNDFIVGFKEELIQIMDKLTGHQPDLQIISVVGMGGIGKTTLAKSVYHNLVVVENFDIRAWVTISQEYTVETVLSELLSCIKDLKVDKARKKVEFETEDQELGQQLRQTLWCRRYLIVLDDIWSLDAWDEIKCFFPNNYDRSRVVITTRISSVATHLSSSSFEMNCLDEDQSWELFCKKMFLEKRCPLELEKIGKKIVRECKGLPLSIVVVGGLLRNSRSTREYWENFARDLNSILMSGNDELCFKLLSLSYNHLLAQLKLCFLYMGVFREDQTIWVSQLIKLFVAEGFLKPKEGQTLEEIAEDCLNELVDRNLVLVDSWKWSGGMKKLKMHDLVREVCLKIGKREKIFQRMLEIPGAGINRELCIVFDGIISKKKRKRQWLDVLPSASLARTFLSSDYGPLPFKFRLLRVLTGAKFESHEDITQHINLRYLNWSLQHLDFQLPSSISLLWNVHTLIFVGYCKVMEAPSEIWQMRQLRHLQFDRILLPDPPLSTKKMEEQGSDVLLPNLHTLSKVVNLSFTEEVCKRIPNIKKLGIVYKDFFWRECQKKCYYYLDHLHKLQSLKCHFIDPKRGEFVESLVLPSSLRKLSLNNCGLHWEDLNTFGLSLPNLQVLKLYWHSIVGDEWDCVEGAFPRLKLLHMQSVDLIKWTAESSDCFPVLEQIHLKDINKLENMPSGIGEIESLESVHVDQCSFSAAISSIEILEQQLNLGNEELRLKVELCCYKEEKQSFMEKLEINSFTTKNFELDIVVHSSPKLSPLGFKFVQPNIAHPFFWSF